MLIRTGFRDEDRLSLANLFWDAFSGKLGSLLGPRHLAIEILSEVIQPGFVIVARQGDQVQGFAGLKSTQGGFFGGEFTDFLKVYGFLGALWRVPALMILDQKITPAQLMIDGLSVDPHFRGQGIGSKLIDACKDFALENGYSELTLFVVGENIRAQALYERHGFVATGQVGTSIFAPILGFRTAKQMSCDLRD